MRALAAALLLCTLGLSACDKSEGIRSVEPAFGNVAGGDDVVIHGNGFEDGMVVQFGKKQTRTVVVETPTRIRVKTPAGVEGKADIVIIRADGKSFVLKDGFTYRSGT